MQFVYDASGAKLRKLANNNGTVTTYDYVNGVEYTNNTLERLPHTEGEIVKDGLGNYVYEYTLKDHLGNTRVTFGDADNNGIVENSEIKQINHYYPFGLNMEGPGFGAQGANKYQYNQKELNSDFGLNWNDYGARFYDASRLQFTTIDPMIEMYAHGNGYQYVSNNPVSNSDPTGMYDWNMHFGSGSSGSAHDMYQRDAAISQSATGKARDVNQDDIALSRKLVTYNVYRSKTPFIYVNTWFAQLFKPKFLTYGGGGKFNRQQREKAQKPWGNYPRIGLKKWGVSIEEYPYAMTKEGGTDAVTFPVPTTEQQTQSGELGKIATGLKEDDLIYVKLINDSGDKDPVWLPIPDPQGTPHPLPPILIPIRLSETSPAEILLQRVLLIIVPSVQGLQWEQSRSPVIYKGV